MKGGGERTERDGGGRGGESELEGRGRVGLRRRLGEEQRRIEILPFVLKGSVFIIYDK